MTPEDLASFQRDGFLLVRNLLNQQEVDLIRTALETDQSLQEQQIQLNDQNEGQTKLALWSNPGDGTLGMLTRSRRVVETVEAMLERSERARFLLGWVIRGTSTAALLEDAALKHGLQWEVLNIDPHLDKVYGELSRHKLFNFSTHERSSLRVWAFRWGAPERGA